MPLNARFARPALAALAVLLVLTAVGCPSASRTPKKRSSSTGRAAQQRASEQSALFNSIRDQLRSLPEATQMNLAPPTVVLDARSTDDGEDIQAVLVRQPENPSGPANVITVPQRNVRFRGQVEPGDILKYYVKPDDETMARELEGGGADIVTYEAIDLVVAQVPGDHALLIQGGLAQEINFPAKLEVWRIADDRMVEIGRQLGEYVSRREPPLGWQPSPDEAEIERLTERLNQWLRQTRLAGKKADASKWGRPALLETLPDRLKGSSKLRLYLADEKLATGYFEPYEVRFIQGALWRRDIARWARGSATEPLAIAEALLDWTTRNLQLVEAAGTPPRWPWEVLLRGQATADERAWVFAGLCEQQNLSVAAVAIPTEAGDYPLVGVLDGEQLRLFDPALGVPIPGPAPGDIASVSEIQADDSLLRALDLEDTAYPVTSEAAKAARVSVVATPFAFTSRAAALAQKLPATETVTLVSEAGSLTARLAAAEGVEAVSLWDIPIATLLRKLEAKPSQRRRAVREFLPFAWRPQLWRARGQHFRGADRALDAAEGEEDADDHREARRLYMNRGVRPTDDRLRRIPAEKRAIYRSAKTLATLYLALISFDEAAHKVSKNWFENVALDHGSAAEYRSLVDYNLARAYEELGDIDRAIELLESVEGPQAQGAKLRARRLRDAAEADGDNEAASE